MIEVLKYIFGNFWVFSGLTLWICIIVFGVTSEIKQIVAIRQMGKIGQKQAGIEKEGQNEK